MIKKFVAFTALTAACFGLSQQAAAQEFEDLPEAEMAALIQFALPSAFSGVQQRCTGTLPKSAFMYANSTELMTRFSTAAEPSWPMARDAIIMMSSQDNPQMRELFNAMPREAIEPFMSEIVAGVVAQKVDLDACAKIDRALQLLDPLPAENLAALVAFIVDATREDEAAVASGE